MFPSFIRDYICSFEQPGIAEMVGLCYNLLHRGLIKWEIVLLVSTVVGFVVRISFVILFCVVPVDERMFLLKVITKLATRLVECGPPASRGPRPTWTASDASRGRLLVEAKTGSSRCVRCVRQEKVGKQACGKHAMQITTRLWGGATVIHSPCSTCSGGPSLPTTCITLWHSRPV